MSKICCFTGHREVDPRSCVKMSERLEALLRELIEKDGFTDFRAGGAVGFDCIAAISVLKLKQEYPHIKLHLVLPCKNQDRYFSPMEKRLYKYVLANADSAVYMQERYSNGVMFVRNRALVSGADLCVAYLARLKGGTYQTVNIARREKVRVINVYK